MFWGPDYLDPKLEAVNLPDVIGVFTRLLFLLLQDVLDYKSKLRIIRVRMLDGAVKTMQVDDSHIVSQLMVVICSRIGMWKPPRHAGVYSFRRIVCFGDTPILTWLLLIINSSIPSGVLITVRSNPAIFCNG